MTRFVFAISIFLGFTAACGDDTSEEADMAMCAQVAGPIKSFPISDTSPISSCNTACLGHAAEVAGAGDVKTCAFETPDGGNRSVSCTYFQACH